MADEPIDEQGFLYGVNVVDIDDVRVARGFSRRRHIACSHRKLRYDSRERRVWCADCETDIDGFDAFEVLVSRLDQAIKDIRKREEAARAAEQASIHLIAARNLEKAWRSKSMLPCCPSCRVPLFPEDFKNERFSMVSKELAYQARNRRGVE